MTNKEIAEALGWTVEYFNNHGKQEASWRDHNGNYAQGPDFVDNLGRVTTAVKAKGHDYAAKIRQFLNWNGLDLWSSKDVCIAILALHEYVQEKSLVRARLDLHRSLEKLRGRPESHPRPFGYEGE